MDATPKFVDVTTKATISKTPKLHRIFLNIDHV
jgi:hypothetical protein